MFLQQNFHNDISFIWMHCFYLRVIDDLPWTFRSLFIRKEHLVWCPRNVSACVYISLIYWWFMIFIWTCTEGINFICPFSDGTNYSIPLSVYPSGVNMSHTIVILLWHTVGSVPKSNRKITGRSTIDTLSTEIQDHSFSCLGTDTIANISAYIYLPIDMQKHSGDIIPNALSV
jgi:hypothetical protein